MNSARQGHGVILVGEKIIVVGGQGTIKNEECMFKNGKFSCTEVNADFYNYDFYPMMYLVDDNYKNCY